MAALNSIKYFHFYYCQLTIMIQTILTFIIYSAVEQMWLHRWHFTLIGLGL